MSRIVPAVAAVVLILGLGDPASAQEPPGEISALEQARRAFKEERYRDAAIGFEAAFLIRSDAVALFTAAQAWELASDSARAADAYARALSTPGLDEHKAARARDRLTALGAELGALEVSGREGTRVQLDDHGQWSVPARLHAAPGEHALRIVHADGAVERRPLTLAAGSVVRVDATPPVPVVSSAPAGTALPPVLPEPRKHPVHDPDAPERSPAWLAVGCSSLGAGVGVLGGALLLGLAAEDADTAAKAAPSAKTQDHADSLHTSTLAMAVAGGVLTAAGAAIVIWQATLPSGASGALRLRLNARRALVEGSF